MHYFGGDICQTYPQHNSRLKVCSKEFHGGINMNKIQKNAQRLLNSFWGHNSLDAEYFRAHTHCQSASVISVIKWYLFNNLL